MVKWIQLLSFLLSILLNNPASHTHTPNPPDLKLLFYRIQIRIDIVDPFLNFLFCSTAPLVSQFVPASHFKYHTLRCNLSEVKCTDLKGIQFNKF